MSVNVTIPACTVYANTLAEANAMAESLACNDARTKRLSMSNLPSWRCAFESFSQTVYFLGATGAFTWQLYSGAFPTGMGMTQLSSNTALFTGTPTTPGTYTFTIRVVMSPTTDFRKTFTMVIFGFVTGSDLPDGTTGTAYSQQIVADGGSGNYLFELESGALPDGLSLGPTGFITGTPTTEETGLFTVRVTDLVTPAHTCTQDFQIEVVAPPVVPRWYYWTLDEAGDVARVDSVAGLILTPGAHMGGGFVSLTAAAGKFSNAVRFQNISPVPGDFAQTVGPLVGPYLNQLAHDGTGFSLCFWIKVNSFGTSLGYVDYKSVVQHGEIALKFTGTFGAYVTCMDDGEAHSEDLTVVMIAGTWYFFHLFYNGTLNKMGYQIDNGAATYASFTPTITAATAGMVSLFQQGTGTPNDFLVDETIVRVDTMFTAAQLAYLYNAGAGRTWPITLP